MTRRVPGQIYMEHGEAYGNLGDIAMLLNAIRRIRDTVGDIHVVLAHKPGAPLPSISNATTIAPPRQALTEVARRLFPSARLRGWIERLSPGYTWRLAGHLTLKSQGRLPGGADWRTLVSALEVSQAVYCVGAANLNDFSGSAAWVKCMVIEQAHRLGLPVIVSSQGIGPLAKRWLQRAVVNSVARASHFSLRDGGTSQSLLVRLGAEPAKLQSVGDESFSLPPGDEAEAQRYLQSQGVDPRQAFALLHFRETDYTTRDTIRHYAKIARALDQSRWEVPFLFMPMSTWRHSGVDVDCGQAIRDLMRRPGRLKVLPAAKDPCLVRRLVEMSQGVVALSYHLQVFALAAVRPMVILSSGEYYRAKAVGMQALVGHDSPLVDLERASIEELQRAIEELEDAPAGRINSLQTVQRRVSEINDAPVRALSQSLKRRDRS